MNLPEIIAELERIDAQSDVKEGALRTFELVRSDAPLNEIAIFGNREGFIYLGLLCLALAEDKRRGAHYQFDQTSIFTRIDVDLVLARTVSDDKHPSDNEKV